MSILLTCMCTTWMPSIHGVQKEVSESLEPKIHVDAGNQTLVLWKNTVPYLQPVKQFLNLIVHDAFQYSRFINACYKLLETIHHAISDTTFLSYVDYKRRRYNSEAVL